MMASLWQQSSLEFDHLWRLQSIHSGKLEMMVLFASIPSLLTQLHICKVLTILQKGTEKTGTCKYARAHKVLHVHKHAHAHK